MSYQIVNRKLKIKLQNKLTHHTKITITISVIYNTQTGTEYKTQNESAYDPTDSYMNYITNWFIRSVH